MSVSNIVIIGAGQAGLCSAKRCIEQGFNVTVYEQSEYIGGIWHYTDEVGQDKYGINIHSAMYQNLTANSPYQAIEYPDFPYPEDTISFPSQSDVLKYLHSYAYHFDLKKFINFNHLVIRVVPIDNKKWEVVVKNLPKNTYETQIFDAVLICNGHYSAPRLPEIPGSEEFKGKIIHSRDFRRAEDFFGDKVLVIGAGFSGVDLVDHLSKTASRITFSQYKIFGETKEARKRRQSLLPPRVELQDDVVRFTSNGVEFIDGTQQLFDAVIYASGYYYSFKFLSADCGIHVDNNFVQPLYKHILNIHYPTMAFISLTSVGSTNYLSDMQGIFVDGRPFAIGQYFDEKSDQKDIYFAIQPLIEKFLEGYCCNVMTYGQSGTGKSYTMGLQSENFESCNIGIVPRALQEIMNFVKKNNDTTVEMSFFEIYNEKVFDLLSDKINEAINTKGSKFTGGVKRPLKTLVDAETALVEGNKNRRTRKTAMNLSSSRSHAVVVIYNQTKSVSSSFYLVDLAGSEGVRRTGHKGVALTEGSHINRGLLGIGNIIKALSDGSCWIPYRDTVLGSVLQDSLNVNAFSRFVICISGLKEDMSETINSLTFAQKVMNLKNVPKLHAEMKKQTPRKDLSLGTSSLNQENFETPIVPRRPIAASTAVLQRSKYRPNLNKAIEKTAPVVLSDNICNRTMDLQNSQLMESPAFRQCFEAMQRTLQKRNIRLKSINFSPVDEASASDSDNSELNLTVIPLPAVTNEVPDSTVISSVQCETNDLQVPETSETQVPETSETQVTETNQTQVPSSSSSIYMTKEECMQYVEAQIANLTKTASTAVVNTQTKDPEVICDLDTIDIQDDINESFHSNHDITDLSYINGQNSVLENDVTLPASFMDNTFEFRVPEPPLPIINRRRSVRIKENEERRKSIVIVPPAQPKQRRRTVTKIPVTETISEHPDVIVESPQPKRRRTISSKKPTTQSIPEHPETIISKSDHRAMVLDLLNKGDMKAIQVLPQVGMKTAYGIITHRSLNGKFKSFKELSKAPFWRGKAFERFEKANNLC